MVGMYFFGVPAYGTRYLLIVPEESLTAVSLKSKRLWPAFLISAPGSKDPPSFQRSGSALQEYLGGPPPKVPGALGLKIIPAFMSLAPSASTASQHAIQGANAARQNPSDTDHAKLPTDAAGPGSIAPVKMEASAADFSSAAFRSKTAPADGSKKTTGGATANDVDVACVAIPSDSSSERSASASSSQGAAGGGLMCNLVGQEDGKLITSLPLWNISLNWRLGMFARYNVSPDSKYLVSGTPK